MLLALIVSSSAGINMPLRAEVTEAQWQVYQVRYFYDNDYSHYTCDGIRLKLKRLLMLLGARNDVRVESPCPNEGRNLRSRYVRRLQRSHSIQLAFAMPVPADKTDISREIIPAEWQETRIVGNLSRYLDAADCELLARFQRQVLPYLRVRSDSINLHCGRYHRGYGVMNTYRSIRVRMTALKALEKTDLEATQ